MCYVEHEKCYREGIVQRDVSVNNIIVSNGEGHLIDFDHAKFTGKFKPMANGVPKRMEEELRRYFLRKFDEAVISRAEEIMGNPIKAHIYLSALTEGIDVREPLTLQDLGWREEVNIIILIGSSLMFPLVICYSFFQYTLSWAWSCHSRLLNTNTRAFLTSHRERLHS